MELKINSEKLGKTLTFSRPGDHFIFVDLNGNAGTLGNHICRGGKILGSSIGYSGDDQKSFESICKTWYRAYLKANSWSLI